MSGQQTDEMVVSGERQANDGPVLWSLRWRGPWRLRNGDGDVLDEGHMICELRVYRAGNWIVCGGDGCVVLADDDPAHLDQLARCLLGRVVRPPG